MTPYIRYIVEGILPNDVDQAKTIRRNAGRYTLIDGHLFRHDYSHALLICVNNEQTDRILTELHEGICGSHIRD